MNNSHNSQSQIVPFFQELDAMFNDFFTEVVSAGSKKQGSFPFTNIYTQIDENTNKRKAVIEIAVAGFSKDEIDILLEENILHVKGKKNKIPDEELQNRVYLMRGLSQKNSFDRRFVIFEQSEEIVSKIIDGILIIEITEKQKELTKTKIEIQ